MLTALREHTFNAIIEDFEALLFTKPTIFKLKLGKQKKDFDLQTEWAL